MGGRRRGRLVRRDVRLPVGVPVGGWLSIHLPHPALVLVVACLLLWLATKGSRGRQNRRRVRRNLNVPHWLYYYRCRQDPTVRRYIGISNCPQVRHRRHELGSDWFTRSTGHMYVVAVYPNFAVAHAVEVAEIRAAWAAGEPIENIAHVPGRIHRRARKVSSTSTRRPRRRRAS